ncbi:MAG: hypothetical protein JOY93_07820 [Acidobacteriales bacterium]|nr:hypothetical protein [Terriglobales bacterium]
MNVAISRRFLVILPASFLLVSAMLFGEGTRTWEQSKFDEFTRGTGNGIAIRSTGGLELAPAFKTLATTPATFIWAIASDPAANLYAATGSPARVYLIKPDGTTEVIFEPRELQVQALVVAKNGIVYAATNPDGKVYRIEHGANLKKEARPQAPDSRSSNWSSSVYFDPGTKYIWDLAMDNSGKLYVATGDHGEIFRVTSKGDHSLFFKSDEVHIRVLAFDSKGNLIAGSDGSGLVYRISPAGEGFVLYSAPKKEITALAIDKAGYIYAAAVGEKRGGSASSSAFSAPGPSPTPAPASGGPGASGSSSASGGSTPVGISSNSGSGGGSSEIYRISPDGSPRHFWSSREDLVYALAFDQQDRLLVGTGNRGHIFRITGEDEYTDLLKASATQVTGFAKTPDGGLYVSTSNLGKVFVLGATSEAEGSYESDVFDARIFSRWGRAEFRGSGNIQLFARSGNVDNPDRNWSDWTSIDLNKDSEVRVPPARFIQWKAQLHSGATPPRLEVVALNYLPQNVAPDFEDITVQLGVRYQSLPKPASGEMVGGQHFDPAPVPSHDRDSIGVKWTVHDDNDDVMTYSVYYRGEGDTRWQLLKGNLSEKFYSFDASLLPDGVYTVKVVASDAPSHSPGQALSGEKESARFEVDTTAPAILNLQASAKSGDLHVSFRASDSFSPIKRAEYSIDAGDWRLVEPIGQLSDSKDEAYDFHAPVAEDIAGNASTRAPVKSDRTLEHVVVVRVYDRYDNMSSAKFVVRGR